MSVVILKTKRIEKIPHGIRLTLGYYMKSRSTRATDQPGVALLLNEMDSKIEILIFLFPYFATSGNMPIFGIVHK